MPTEPEQFNEEEIYASEDVLGRAPGYLIRTGMTYLALALTLFLALAWFIKYPDTLATRIEIVTDPPPMEVFPKVSGTMEELMAKDKEDVKKGQLLAVMEAPGGYKDMSKVKGLIEGILPLSLSNIPDSLPLGEELDLGRVNSSYQLALNRLRDLKFFLRNDVTYKKIGKKKEEIRHLENLNRSIARQEGLYDEIVGLVEKQRNREQEMHDKDFISDQQLEEQERKLLEEKVRLETYRTQQINNEIRIGDLREQILQLETDYESVFASRKTEVERILRECQGSIREWEESYLLVAPMAGQLSMGKVWTSGQYIASGTAAFTILPNQQHQIIARCDLPVVGSGNVEPGNRMMIVLDAYRESEYGKLQTTVNDVSLVPSNDSQFGSSYTLTAQMEVPLTTTYKKQLEFRQKMPGTATIITKEKRLLTRIFDQLIVKVAGE